LVSGILLGGGACSDPELLPEELLGVWVTDAPAYAERSFTLRRDSVKFETGQGGQSGGRIKGLGVKWDRSRNATLYTVEYETRVGELSFPFYYVERDQPVILFKNQPGIQWTRAN
jgi:hypothetical protein